MRTSGWGVGLVGVAGGLVLVLLGAAASEASDASDPSVFNTCVQRNGEARIVKPSESCRQNETALHWDIPGPASDALAPGSRRPTGEPAPLGPSGRSVAVEELNGRPCTTPGGPEGMVIEVRFYGKNGIPTLRCRVPGGRFIDHGDQTVTDTLTGLMWEKKVAGGNWGNTCLTELHGVGSACTWDQAMDDWLDLLNGWCDSCAGKGGFAGYTDWRLPTVAELLTILDTSRVPAINPAFGETEAREYLTASSDDAGPPAAVAVNFYNGGAIEVSKSYPTRVRAVRGGP